MIRSIKALALLLILPSLAIAQSPPYIRNDALATINGANLGPASAAVDGAGRISIGSITPGTGATDLGKAEDSVHTSGATGVMTLGVRNDTAAILAGTDGDYSTVSITPRGAQQVAISSLYGTGTVNILKDEDAAAASGDALVGVATVRSDTFNTTGGNGDYVVPISDTSGRLAVNGFGAGITEWFSSCGTATASTADVAIKAAVASNRNYISSVTCASSDADNATNINFKDGSTVVAVGGVNQMATTSSGAFTAQFNPPLRGTSNTAFNFNTAVSTSSVICCASGYISVN